jgi:hypothetical protein
MKKFPEGYPLKPIDSKGSELSEGDRVEILVIPEWLLNGLEEDAQNAIKSCEGQIMIIYEVDEYGFMWVAIPTIDTENNYEAHHFSMEPKNLRKVE